MRTAVKDDPKEIWVKLFQDVVSAVVSEVDATVLEDATGRAILLWIVGRRNALLQQLA
jgi:hypothetical protein